MNLGVSREQAVSTLEAAGGNGGSDYPEQNSTKAADPQSVCIYSRRRGISIVLVNRHTVSSYIASLSLDDHVYITNLTSVMRDDVALTAFYQGSPPLSSTGSGSALTVSASRST